MNSGSLESLKVSSKWGLRPKACQMRTTEFCETPASAAMSRVLQCVAFLGLLSKVLTMISSILSSPMVRGAPGRGSSCKPSSPRSRNRLRHLPTVSRVVLSLLATATSESPPAHAKTMRARSASACAVFARRVHRSKMFRSCSFRTRCFFRGC